jgi:stearoyl-CoA desaturase (delta-9 desaturase)
MIEYIIYFLKTNWLYIAVIAISWEFTINCTSLYLHRSMTHKGVTFATPIAFLMRLWIWLTSTVSRHEWVAVHLKHHAFPDQQQDPHSPYQQGFWKIQLIGVWPYIKASCNKELTEKFGKSCPEDWLDKNWFVKYRHVGIFIMLAINVALFGWPWGPIIWLCQVLAMVIQGQIINAAGHTIGYRSADVDDHSTNIMPIGIILDGEELHNNHHANPASPKLSRRWFEFDKGWMYIRLLSMLRLAKVRYSTTK